MPEDAEIQLQAPPSRGQADTWSGSPNDQILARPEFSAFAKCPIDALTAKQQLLFFPWVISRIDVDDAPWADTIELYNGLFVGVGKVRHAWRHGEETTGPQGLGLA